ncbi:hypothetical protein COB55_01445 [Candidatus Wolfebacteria bacterium]|nr:MAG: hypothetical protein COB55_01445 [Candidatus Wolfebacteria bacterium]
MIFSYEAIDQKGERKGGTIEAITQDVAISSLQRRGLLISSISATGKGSLLSMNISIFERVTNRELVMLSRQIATLFGAHVAALKVFRMLAQETSKPLIARTLDQVAIDLQGGTTIHKALAKHPKIFSPFYVNMISAGEESGKLADTFEYLADYMERSYEVVSKTRNALVYPVFVVFVFLVVMIFMFTAVVPNITSILVDSGQDIPFYTQVIIHMSDFLVAYGLFLLVGVIVGGFFLWKYIKTKAGNLFFARVKISVPVVGNLYRKLYLSRLADNMSTMLASGIPMVRVIEVTATVIGNAIYEDVLRETAQAIQTGTTVSQSLGRFPDEIPGIVTQMIAVGEETGELGNILHTLSDFYRREVENAVDTMIGLIEPAMIVFLGFGVLFLLVAILVPIYNISAGF